MCFKISLYFFFSFLFSAVLSNKLAVMLIIYLSLGHLRGGGKTRRENECFNGDEDCQALAGYCLQFIFP